MKKTLALMAGCALCVSAATAAVQGNNTAVIISKTPEVTTASYQFLCVPVRGFDITGQAGNGFVALGSFLPASTLTEGTTLILPGEGNTQTIYKVSGGAWVKEDSTGGTKALAAGAEPQVKTGTVLWLRLPASAIPSTIYFVGEKGRTLAEGEKLIPSPAAGMVAYGNDTDTAVPLSQVAAAQDGDQIQCIEDGGATYKVYIYMGDPTGEQGNWFDWNTFAVADSITIAPGEAFYYYRAQSAE